MASFDLSDLAKSDLIDIYQYGVRQWGEAQADRYYHTLFDHLHHIANDPPRYPPVEHIRPGYRRSVFGSHAIYFRVVENRTQIMAIMRAQNTRRLRD